MNRGTWQNGLDKGVTHRIEVLLGVLFCAGIIGLILSDYPGYVIEYGVYGLIFMSIFRWIMRRNRAISIFVYLTMHTFGYLFFIPVIVSQHKRFVHPGWLSIGYFKVGADSFVLVMICSLGFLVSVAWLSAYFDKRFFNFCRLDSRRRGDLGMGVVRVRRNDRDIVLASLFVVANVLVTLFMFKNQIGITGIEPERLPFKLVGILYYYRLLILPIVYMLMARRIACLKNWWVVTIMLFISANIFALASGSKAILVIYMAPVLAMIVIRRKWLLAVGLSAVTFLLLPFYAGVRNLLFPLRYDFGYTSFDISQLGAIYNYLVDRLLSDPGEIIEYGLIFLGRALGVRELLMSTYTDMRFEDPRIFFSGYLDLLPDEFKATDLTGLALDPEKGFAAGVDILSYIALSSPSVAWALLFVVIFVLVLLTLEKIIRMSLATLGLRNELSYLILTLLFLRYVQRLDSLPIIAIVLAIVSFTISMIRGRGIRRDLL